MSEGIDVCKALHLLLVRGWSSSAHLDSILKALEIDPKHARFVVLQIRLDGYAQLIQKLGMDALGALRREMIDRCERSVAHSMCTFGADDMLTVLLVMDGFLKTDELNQALSALREWAYEAHGIRLTVGIGTYAMRAEDIYESARNAQIATSYRFVFGLGQDIEYDGIRMRVGQSLPYPKSIERELLDALRKGNAPQFEMKLAAFFDAVCQGATNYAKVALYTLMMQIYCALPDQMQPDCDLVGVHAELQRVEYYLDWQRIIRLFGLSNMPEAAQKNSDRYKELGGQIIEYVERNYPNPDLSVVSIAEHAGVSQNTIRQVFKEQFDSMPRDYITRVRIDEACRLLTTTDLTAKDISARVGFQESRYFYNVFKKQTGETAFEFRIHAQRRKPVGE